METQRLILVAAAVVQLALWLMLAGRYRIPAAAPGSTVLSYGWKWRFLALCLAFGIPMVSIVAAVLTPPQIRAALAPIGLLLIISGLAAGATMIETQGVYLILTDAGILGVSPWRSRREWRWHEIERVSYSRLNRWLVLTGPRQETIRAPFFLVGIRNLAQAVIKNVPGPKCAPARKVLDRLAR